MILLVFDLSIAADRLINLSSSPVIEGLSLSPIRIGVFFRGVVNNRRLSYWCAIDIETIPTIYIVQG